MLESGRNGRHFPTICLTRVLLRRLLVVASGAARETPASTPAEWLVRTSHASDPCRVRLRDTWATMLKARLQRDEGQTFVEYALILAAVVVGGLLAFTATPLGIAIQNAVTSVSNALAP